MADQKLTDRTENTTPANDDWVHVVKVADDTSYKMQVSNLVSINKNAGVFTGEFDVSSGYNNFYTDYDTGGSVTLSLSATKKLGSICKVRINGDLILGYPSDWILRGDAISTLATKINDILILYVSDTEIILTNVLMDVPTTQLYPNDFDDEAMWQKFDIATTNDVGGIVTVATDSLTTTSYPMSNFGSPTRAIQNTKECIHLDGAYMKMNDTAINTVFTDSFTVAFKVKLMDGNPVSAKYLVSLMNQTSGRFWIDFRTDGDINIAYAAGGVSKFAQTLNPVFSDGAMSDFATIIVTVTSGDFIRLYIDGVLIPFEGGSNNGDISAVTMANFTTTQILAVGGRIATSSTDNMYVKDFTIQPIIYTPEQMANFISMP